MQSKQEQKLLKENNKKMPYASEVIKKKNLRKNNDLFMYLQKSPYKVKWSEMS